MESFGVLIEAVISAVVLGIRKDWQQNSLDIDACNQKIGRQFLRSTKTARSVLYVGGITGMEIVYLPSYLRLAVNVGE